MNKGMVFLGGLLLGFWPAFQMGNWIKPQSSTCSCPQDPPILFQTPDFGDLEVYETVTRRKLTRGEVMEILDKQPNIKTVSLPMKDKLFSVRHLAYPQHAKAYQIPAEVWADLQAFCRHELIHPAATDNVVAHWRKIADGTPPFGLTVAKAD